jgi:hypothetical protein
LPAGTRAVSVFVVNELNPATEERAEESKVFQAELRLRLETGFVPRPVSGAYWNISVVSRRE